MIGNTGFVFLALIWLKRIWKAILVSFYPQSVAVQELDEKYDIVCVSVDICVLEDANHSSKQRPTRHTTNHSEWHSCNKRWLKEAGQCCQTE